MSCVPPCASIPAQHGKVALGDRPPIPPRDATALSALFKLLANDTRLRLIHALVRAEELCVTELAQAVGMAPQAVSNQLQRLADRRVVVARREGVRLYYSLNDPCVAGLLDLGMCLLEETATPTAARPARRRASATERA
jgi:ArsR family transcriptional regulator, lead/cadmium/zinc/bismuth-responsive transcriptional repressor